MYEELLPFHVAQAAAHELRETHGGAHAHTLRHAPALATSLKPMFAGEHPLPNFDTRLWTRVLRFSSVEVSDEEALDPEKLYEKAKQGYAALERVAIPGASANAEDIECALNFCNGIERGTRRHMTARQFKGIENA